MKRERHERPLGDAREAVLIHLARHEGEWRETPHAWRWERSTHWTRELLYSLGALGLVTVRDEDTFTLTERGWQRARDLADLHVWTR